MSNIRRLIYLVELLKNQWISEKKLLQIQEVKLINIGKYAYNNSHYYARKFDSLNLNPKDIKSVKDLRKIPFLTKEDIRKNFDDLIVKRINLKKCRIVPTSGSTGTPLKIVYDEKSDDFSKAVNLRSHIANGLNFNDNWFNIGDTRTAQKRTWFQKLGFFSLQQLSLFENVENQVKILKNKNATIITGYPSQLRLISEYLIKNKINLNIKRVFSTAELLEPQTREIIKRGFGCDVIDLFGCIEVNRTAWECEKHEGYHIDIDSVVFEILDSNGNPVKDEETGEIVYTSLNNFAMPLIRYKVGDMATSFTKKCSCGRRLPLIKRIDGRNDSFILTKKGGKISPILIALIFKHSKGIDSYKVIQESYENITIEIVKGNKFSGEELEKIKEEFRKYYGNFKFKIMYKNRIEMEKSGKIRSVICKIN